MASNNHQSDRNAIVIASEVGNDPEMLWQTADRLSGSVHAAKYKHVVLGRIFLKYVSDAFEARRARRADELQDGFAASARLEARMKANLEGLGYGKGNR